MATTDAVDACPAKKRKIEDDDNDDKEPSKLAGDSDSDSDGEYYVPLTEEFKRQISDFQEAYERSGGFDVPKIPQCLLNRVVPQIQLSDCQTDETLIDVVNTAIKHHKKKKKKNEMMDLVLVDIVSAATELVGTWQDFITFKARDSTGAVRTYETLIDPRFGDEDPMMQIFRVKPYTSIEYPEHNKVERPRELV